MGDTAPTLSDRMRQDKDAIVSAMVERTQALRAVTGDTPLSGAKLDARRQAERTLGEWFILGQAEPPISDEYWSHKLQSGLTPVQLKEWDRAMQRAWKDGKYIPDAIEALHPDLVAVYRGLRASGQHSGRVSLPAGAQPAADAPHAAPPPPEPPTNGKAAY